MPRIFTDDTESKRRAAVAWPCGAAVGRAAAAHGERGEAALGGLEGQLADREDGILQAGRDHGEIAGIFRPQLEARARCQ